VAQRRGYEWNFVSSARISGISSLNVEYPCLRKFRTLELATFTHRHSQLLFYKLHFSISTFRIMNSKQYSPFSEANSGIIMTEIYVFFLNLKIYYRVQNSPLPVSTLSQINPMNPLPFCFFKINLISPSHLGLSPPMSSSFRFPY